LHGQVDQLIVNRFYMPFPLVSESLMLVGAYLNHD